MSTQAVEICKKWIDAGYIKPRKTINKSLSSYSFKHFVEYWAGEYISNDEFIQAMIEKGYKARKVDNDCPNYFFNWSYANGHDWYSTHKGL